MGMPVAPVWEQEDYAFYSDGTESGATIIGTAGTQQTLTTDTVYHCRILIAETAGAVNQDPDAALTVRWQFNLAGGGWTDVGTTTAVQFVNNANLTDGGTTTNRQPTGTGTFNAGRIYESANNTATVYTTPDNGSTTHTEVVLHFQIDSAQVSDGQECLLRCTHGDGTALGVYVVNADIDINEPAGPQTLTNDYISAGTTVHEPTWTGNVDLVNDYISAGATAHEPTLSSEYIFTAGFISAGSTAYEPTVLAGNVNLVNDFITAGTAVHEPSAYERITKMGPYGLPIGAQYFGFSRQFQFTPLNAGFITSASTTYEPTLTSEYTLTAGFIAAGSTAHEPTVPAGEVNLQAGFITAGSTAHEPTLTAPAGDTIVAGFISASSTLYEPTAFERITQMGPYGLPIGAQYFGFSRQFQFTPLNAGLITAGSTAHEPTVAAGEVTLLNDHIAAGSTAHEPTALAGEVNLQAGFITSSSTTYEPTTLAGEVNLQAGFVAAGSTAHEPTLTAPAGNTVVAGFIDAGNVVYEPTWTGSVDLVNDYISAGSAAHEPALASEYAITVGFIAAGSTAYEPTVAAGEVNLLNDFISAGTAAHEPTAVPGEAAITNDFISASSTAHEPSLQGSATIVGDFISALSTAYEPSVADQSFLQRTKMAPYGLPVGAQYDLYPRGEALNINVGYIAPTAALFEPTFTEGRRTKMGPYGLPVSPQYDAFDKAQTGGLFVDFIPSQATVYTASASTPGANFLQIDFFNNTQVFEPNAFSKGVVGDITITITIDSTMSVQLLPQPALIASTATVYTPLLSASALQFVLPSQIGPTSTLHEPTFSISAFPQTLAADAIAASSTVFGVAGNLTGQQSILPNHIGSTTIAYTPDLPYSVDFIAAGSTAFDPTLTSASLPLSADFIAGVSQAYNLTNVAPGSVTVTPTLISITDIYNPTVISTAILTPAQIASTATAPEPVVYSAADQQISPTTIASTQIFEPLPSTPSLQVLSADFAASGTVLYDPLTSTPSLQTLISDYISTNSSLFAPNVWTIDDTTREIIDFDLEISQLVTFDLEISRLCSFDAQITKPLPHGNTELIINGDFSISDTTSLGGNAGWSWISQPDSWAIQNGVAEHIGPSIGVIFTRNEDGSALNATPGQLYTLTYTIIDEGLLTNGVNLGGATLDTDGNPLPVDPGTYTRTVRAAAANQTLLSFISKVAPSNAKIDNVSVTEV